MGEKTLESLFVSKVRIKVLQFFMLNPEARIHMRGLVREIEEEINAVRRELVRLEEIGVVLSEDEVSKKYFQVNKDSPFFHEFQSIFHKSFGLGGRIIQSAPEIGQVKFALLTEDYLKQTHTGPQKIDLVVVGNIDVPKLTELVEEAEKARDTEIFYTVLSEREFLLKRKRRDPFIVNIILQRHVLLVGNYDDLIS